MDQFDTYDNASSTGSHSESSMTVYQPDTFSDIISIENKDNGIELSLVPSCNMAKSSLQNYVLPDDESFFEA